MTKMDQTSKSANALDKLNFAIGYIDNQRYIGAYQRYIYAPGNLLGYRKVQSIQIALSLVLKKKLMIQKKLRQRKCDPAIQPEAFLSTSMIETKMTKLDQTSGNCHRAVDG